MNETTAPPTLKHRTGTDAPGTVAVPEDETAPRPDAPEPDGGDRTASAPEDEAPALLEEVVVEEVGIDGMCGVY